MDPVRVVPALVRIARPKPLPAPPPVDLGRCRGTRDCLDGECWCGEPLTADYLLPDGWSGGWEE
ncbi:hypothetical protein ACIQBJ_31895 [Kitasatospora sp. NPDC088391]|uniref:hypothetical protein n=1 Tax=Kitasatospora sp. NPDC088391 TaxID=3364074 RepID=UPI003826361A